MVILMQNLLKDVFLISKYMYVHVSHMNAHRESWKQCPSLNTIWQPVHLEHTSCMLCRNDTEYWRYHSRHASKFCLSRKISDQLYMDLYKHRC